MIIIGSGTGLSPCVSLIPKRHRGGDERSGNTEAALCVEGFPLAPPVPFSLPERMRARSLPAAGVHREKGRWAGAACAAACSR